MRNKWFGKFIKTAGITLLILCSVLAFNRTANAETELLKQGDGWYLTKDMTLFIENNAGWQDCLWKGNDEELNQLVLGKDLTEFELFSESDKIDSYEYACPLLQPKKITVEEGNPVFYIENKCLYNRITNELVLAETDITEADIPYGITSVGTIAFFNRTQLERISFPDTLIKISDSAFNDCELLSDFTLPSGLVEIGGGAFAGCNTLESIHIPDTVTSLGAAIVGGCEGLTDIDISNLDIKAIPNSMFDGCSNLVTVKLPDNYTKIGYDAFRGCEKLKNVNIPASVTEIGSYAFAGCKSLTHFNLPDGIKEIKAYTFWGCTGLTTFDIPDSVQRIGVNAFSNCIFPLMQFPEGITLDGGEESKYSRWEQTSQENYLSSFGVYEVQLAVFKGDNIAIGLHTFRTLHTALFLGKPPEFTLGAGPLATEIYYLDEYKEDWAPNNETMWNYSSIHSITREQAEEMIANVLSPTPSPTMAPTNTPVMQEENSVPIETEKETSSIDAMMIILGCSISVVLLIIVMLVVKRSRNKK